MPTLGAALNFAQLEGRNFRAHQLNAAPGGPVTGQLYYDTVANVLFYYNGTIWISTASPADATASAKGIVQLAGDLGGGGSAAAPVIANGAITSAKIADGTITDVDVAAPNKDGVVGTPSLRTLGYGTQQAMQGNTKIDQLANNGATNPITASTQRITNMGDPTNPQDAATKNYVDTVAQGLNSKAPVYCATTTNITLSGTAGTIDNQSVVAGNRVLVKDQTDKTQNGIYIVAAGAWTRAVDADSWTELVSAFVFVEQGTANMDTGWVCTADPGYTLGTNNVIWVQFSAAGQITPGAGLNKAGNVISVVGDNVTIDTNGSFSSVEVKPGGIGTTQLANGAVDLTTKVTNVLPIANGGTGGSTAAASRTALGVAGYYNNNATHGAGTTITITQATHGLRATRAIHVQVQDNSTGNVEIPDISVAANGDVTVTYSASVAANSKLVTLVG